MDNINLDVQTAIQHAEEYHPQYPSRFLGTSAPAVIQGCPVLFVERSIIDSRANIVYAGYTEGTEPHTIVLAQTTHPMLPELFRPWPTISRPRSVEEIVGYLLSPGFTTSTTSIPTGGMAILDMNFVASCMGTSDDEHLEYSPRHRRPILKRESALLTRGPELGIPRLYMNWLGGAIVDRLLRIPKSSLRAAYGAMRRKLEEESSCAWRT